MCQGNDISFFQIGEGANFGKTFCNDFQSLDVLLHFFYRGRRDFLFFQQGNPTHEGTQRRSNLVCGLFCHPCPQAVLFCRFVGLKEKVQQSAKEEENQQQGKGIVAQLHQQGCIAIVEFLVDDIAIDDRDRRILQLNFFQNGIELQRIGIFLDWPCDIFKIHNLPSLIYLNHGSNSNLLEDIESQGTKVATQVVAFDQLFLCGGPEFHLVAFLFFHQLKQDIGVPNNEQYDGKGSIEPPAFPHAL